VTLLGDRNCPGGVTFAFTERTGGVSEGAYASLNLGGRCEDVPEHVLENRRRALAALGAEDLLANLVEPKQVHGARVVRVCSNEPEALAQAKAEAQEGADAIVCTAKGVPVLLCFADCVPVVLVAPGAFAVAHSGWKGTIARISQAAVLALCEAAGCEPADVRAYVGPHIGVADYEVSEELLERFVRAFGEKVRGRGRTLDLGAAVMGTLLEAGVPEGQIACVEDSTAASTDRFYSYRAEAGHTGRHGAIAFMAGE
jgi:YfiH family protein